MAPGEVLEAVLRLAARGWRLFPCAPNAKTPLLKNWPGLASSCVSTIREWAAKHPGCNWGVACGPGSGFVLDVDGEKGRASLAALEAAHGALPATLVSLTGRMDGGEHRWFAWQDGFNIRNSTSKIGAGLDIRGDGGYVIVPPCIHETGRPYQWVNPDASIADAPLWLLELVTASNVARVRTPAAEIGILTEGRRNDGLFRRGCSLRRKGATHQEIEETLLADNARRCKPPLEDWEVLKIAASAARYPVGGPDPLEIAWQATQAESHPTHKAQFLALCRHLQSARPGLNFALPIERIGELMGVHWTSVSNYRKDAVKRGLLVPAEQYIAHRLAGQYRMIDSTSLAERKTLTKPTNLTSGLVRTCPSENASDSLSENCSSTPQIECQSADLRRSAFPRCPTCASFFLYKCENAGTYECQTCGLENIEAATARRMA